VNYLLYFHLSNTVHVYKFINVVVILSEMHLCDKVSVIIPTHNRREVLRRCIEAILNQSVKVDEIIVVDTPSNDGTREMIETSYPQVKYIDVKGRNNVLIQRSAGLMFAKNDVVIFIDDDVIVEKNCIENLVMYLRHEEVVAVGGIERVLNKSLKRQRLQDIGRVSRFGFLRTGFELVNKPIYVDHLRTACIALKRSKIQEIGGFDSFYISDKLVGYDYRADSDLCFRLRKRGYKIVLNPHAKYTHVRLPKPYTDEQRKKGFYYVAMRNTIYFMLKNFEFPKNIMFSLLNFIIGATNCPGVLRHVFNGIKRNYVKRSIFYSLYAFLGGVEGVVIYLKYLKFRI